MTPAEAKKTIACYLAGQRVSRAVLENAWSVLHSAAEQLRPLGEELGLEGEWGSECDVFLSHLAEFSELSKTEREQRMPESVAHVEDCASCRRAYWNVRPLWISEAASALQQKAGAIRRRLAEPIRLAIDQTARLLEQGIGPLSTAEIAGATAGALLGAAPEGRFAEPMERKEWMLKDEQEGCVIHLIVCGLPSGQAGVNCALEAASPAAAQPEQARIELRDAEHDSLHLAGRLSDFQAEPILLPQGSWILRVQSSSREGARTWDLPLELVAARPEP